MNISIKVDDEATIRKINQIGTKFADFRNAFQQIGEDSVKYFEDRPFLSGGQIYGNRWVPLKSSTSEWKAKHGFRGMPMLVRSGQMKGDFHFEAQSRSLKIYNGTDYFQYHQMGTSKMPQRLILAFDDNRKSRVVDIIREDINRKLHG